MSDTTTATTILQQLGGRRFVAMTGAKNFMAIPNGVVFALPGGGGFCKHGINHVQITLDPSDTYTLTFSKVRRAGLKIDFHETTSDIYNDQLQDVFTRYTGLVTRPWGAH